MRSPLDKALSTADLEASLTQYNCFVEKKSEQMIFYERAIAFTNIFPSHSKKSLTTGKKLVAVATIGRK